MNRNILTTLTLLISMCVATNIYADNYEKDQFTTPEGKKLEITFVKHGTLMLNYDGQVIHIDPVSDYADYTQMPKADLILITHEHGDHLDMKAINNIRKENTKIISNAGAYKTIQMGDVMGNGDKKQVTPYLLLEAVPAYNNTPGREKFHPKHRDNGYVLNMGGMRIYVAGDTEDIDELKELKNIDVAFLPINQPYTMTPEQGARAAKMFNPKILYPYHYGETKIEELKTLLSNTPAIEVRIRQLQ